MNWRIRYPKCCFPKCPLIFHFSFLRHLLERKSEVRHYFRSFSWIFTGRPLSSDIRRPPEGIWSYMGNFRSRGHLLEVSDTFRSSGLRFPRRTQIYHFTMEICRKSVANILPQAHEESGFFVVWIPEVYGHGLFPGPTPKKTLKQKDLHSPKERGHC